VIARVAGLLFLAASLLLPSVSQQAGAEEGKGPLKLNLGGGGAVSWQDRQDEASYHVSGSVDYWPPTSCGPERLQVGGEHQTFDQLLPAGTTNFAFPPPNDARLTFRKDSVFSIEALDADGNIIVRDGFAFTADPFCTAEELAAAGSGPSSPGGANIAVLTPLLVVGIGGVAAGAIMRHKSKAAQ
jgi:hypothetical protein